MKGINLTPKMLAFQIVTEMLNPCVYFSMLVCWFTGLNGIDIPNILCLLMMT